MASQSAESEGLRTSYLISKGSIFTNFKSNSNLGLDYLLAREKTRRPCCGGLMTADLPGAMNTGPVLASKASIKTEPSGGDWVGLETRFSRCLFLTLSKRSLCRPTSRRKRERINVYPPKSTDSYQPAYRPNWPADSRLAIIFFKFIKFCQRLHGNGRLGHIACDPSRFY